MTLGQILGWIVAGLVVGAVARLLVPGRQRIGCAMTVVVGIVGAVVGGWLASLFLGFNPVDDPFDIASIVVAVVGAVVVVLVVGFFTGNRRTNTV